MFNFWTVYCCEDGQSDSIVQDIENMVRSYIEKVTSIHPTFDLMLSTLGLP